MVPELTEVLDKILQIKKLTQAELGERIGASQSVVSKMRTGSDWATHWQIFLKLLPLCLELELIQERDLLPPRHARESNPGHRKASPPKASARGQ